MKTYRIIIIVLMLSVLGLPTAGVKAVTNYNFTVNTTSDTNDFNLADGGCSDKILSDPTARCSLRAAVQQINYDGGSSNSISIPVGDYYLTRGALSLIRQVSVTGAGATGISPTLISTSTGVDAGFYVTVNVNLRSMKISNFSEGVRISAGETVIENCIINGNNKGLNVNGDASPITVTVRNSTIKENYKGIWQQGGSARSNLILDTVNVAMNEGSTLGCGSGARVKGNSSLLAINSSFSDNTNTSNGGALCAEDGGSITLNNSQVIGNSSDLRGGGIYIDYGSVYIINGSHIYSNLADEGGGIYNTEGLLEIESPTDAVEISDNQALTAYGGVYIGPSNLDYDNRIENAIISNNSSPQNGGLTFENSSLFTIKNSVFTENTSYLRTSPSLLEGDGGGLMVDCTECVLHISNTTFSKNSTTRYGGGIALKHGNISLNNVTIYGNIADSDNAGTIKGSGGGVYNESGTLNMTNSLVAGNEDRTVSMIVQGYDIDGDLNSFGGYNLIGGCDFLCTLTGVTTGNIVGSHNAKIDPHLGALQLDGSVNRYDQLFHPLLPGSPAANAGNPSGCKDVFGDLLTDDQAGHFRPQSTRCDIGAYESAIQSAVGSIYLPMIIR